MNNAENFPVDAEEQRDWLLAHKSAKGLSWSRLADITGIAAGTLSGFAGEHYQGNRDNIARLIFKFRQTLDSQAAVGLGIPDAPGYFETPTSRRLMSLLVWAHRGRMTLAATGPGTGKTMTIAEYQASASNVWVVTMEQASGGLNSMIMAVLRSLGVTAKGGWGAQLSQLVKDSVVGRRGLLVIDEANHLDLKALEQIRAWHDMPGGPGVCLLGNEELLMRIEGGSRRDAFGRLNSRIAQRHLQHSPVEGDVEAFCDAWNVRDDGMRAMLKRIALTPASGGLRECQQLIEQASMLAMEDDQPLSLAALRDAQSTRATRYIRT
jgi:hypothetical protein